MTLKSVATSNPHLRGCWQNCGLRCSVAATTPNLTKKARHARERLGKAAADPVTGLAIVSGMIATSQRATVSAIAGTEIAGAMDAGESLRILNL